ncbi:DUF222 domain-containing protein, partial [Mycobacterium tuberculosis]|uniref:DUF222 domain-containing protein n=1 Tax=Mycobacterium tuberculosis TaxID=1773 RepID=UPI001F1A6BF5
MLANSREELVEVFDALDAELDRLDEVSFEVLTTPERLVEVFDALDAELDRLDEVSFEVLTTPERLRSLERLECLVRRLPAVGHALINQLDAQASEEELGGTLCCALANRLRITKPDAARRIADAADLGPRRALTGEPLAPQLTATATAQRQGLIGEAHIKVIR